jgi:hypothetical protein
MSTTTFPIVRCPPGPAQEALMDTFKGMGFKVYRGTGDYVGMGKATLLSRPIIMSIDESTIVAHPLNRPESWGGRPLTMVNSPAHMVACVKHLKKKGEI